MQIEQLEHAFIHRLNAKPDIIVRAPGRVELIGGHTDYNDGFVLPMAIDRSCIILARRRSDQRVRIYSEFYDQSCEFDLSAELSPGDPAWANYGKGVASLLIKAGKKLSGLDMYLSCNVPAGGGLSSSAAIEVAYAHAFLAAAGETLDGVQLALLCQQAEHNFANTPCGIMDQFISALGRAEHALFLDCRTHAYQNIPMPLQHASILIADTKVKHNLGQSGYPLRRKQCFEVVDIIKKDLPNVTHLRDIDMPTLERYKSKLDPAHFARAKHVIGENVRVRKTAEAFKNNDLAAAGHCMSQSHNSLRDDYQVSCEELDFLVDQARDSHGVYGARMSGGGFGGCIVALVDNQFAQEIQNRLTDAYNKKYGKFPGIFCTGAAAGAEVLKS